MLMPSSLFLHADDRVRLTYGRGVTAELLLRWATDLRERGLECK